MILMVMDYRIRQHPSVPKVAIMAWPTMMGICTSQMMKRSGDGNTNCGEALSKENEKLSLSTLIRMERVVLPMGIPQESQSSIGMEFFTYVCVG